MKVLRITESFVVKKASYERFAKIQNEIVNSADKDIKLILDIPNRLGYGFLFLFSTMTYLAQKHNKIIEIYCNNKTSKLFKKIGYINKEIECDDTSNVSSMLKEHMNLITNVNDIIELVTEITNEAPVIMSPELSAIFISKAGEMYNNAMEHSQGEVLGAKYFKNQKNTYCFACYDTGIGIPAKVMNVREEIQNQTEAFKWAMIRGNSTAIGVVPRGLGLGLLQSFAKANDGAIRICSGKVLYTYNKTNGEKYYEFKNEFHGTLFEMDIVADNNKKYILR